MCETSAPTTAALLPSCSSEYDPPATPQCSSSDHSDRQRHTMSCCHAFRYHSLAHSLRIERYLHADSAGIRWTRSTALVYNIWGRQGSVWRCRVIDRSSTHEHVGSNSNNRFEELWFRWSEKTLRCCKSADTAQTVTPNGRWMWQNYGKIGNYGRVGQ